MYPYILGDLLKSRAFEQSNVQDQFFPEYDLDII